MFGVAGNIVTCTFNKKHKKRGHQKVGAHARAGGRPGTSVSIIDWHAEEVLRVLAGTSVQGTASSGGGGSRLERTDQDMKGGD